MAQADVIAQIQACINNILDRTQVGKKQIAGVIGDAPSHYSKSPALWNAAFRALGVEAIYLPFDVDESQLAGLADVLRQSDRVMGVSVTVPHKVKMLEYLDELDEKAKHIKAVNTIVRAQDGRLIGYNTDGKGFLDSLFTLRPGQERPLLESLRGMDVLMIGAGGAARSLAFYLGEILENGNLLICNRTLGTARLLAEEVQRVFGNGGALQEKDLETWAPKARLIINCSIKGQGGIRKTQDGLTTFEPYSALAAANPAAIADPDLSTPEFYRAYLKASLPDIEANNRASWELALTIPLSTRFCDLIYSPEETVFLRHGRFSGHRTLNGRGMLVNQAADAFFHKVCRAYIEKLGIYNPDTYNLVVRAMHDAW